MLIDWGDEFTLTSMEDHYFKTDSSPSNTFVNIDLEINYEVFCREIYINYCVPSATCSSYLETMNTVQNTLF